MAETKDLEESREEVVLREVKDISSPLVPARETVDTLGRGLGKLRGTMLVTAAA